MHAMIWHSDTHTELEPPLTQQPTLYQTAETKQDKPNENE